MLSILEIAAISLGVLVAIIFLICIISLIYGLTCNNKVQDIAHPFLDTVNGMVLDMTDIPSREQISHYKNNSHYINKLSNYDIKYYEYKIQNTYFTVDIENIIKEYIGYRLINGFGPNVFYKLDYPYKIVLDSYIPGYFYTSKSNVFCTPITNNDDPSKNIFVTKRFELNGGFIIKTKKKIIVKSGIKFTF